MSRTSPVSRLGASVVALLLPLTSSCGGTFTGPSTALSDGQVFTAGEAIFRQTVLVALDLPRSPNDESGADTILDCTGAGSVSTRTFIQGASDPDAGTANLRYDLITTYDGCLEGAGDDELVITTTPTATGVRGEFVYQAFPTGEVEIDGTLNGRVELDTGSVTLNCRVVYELVGDGEADSLGLTFSAVGEICGAPFAFDLTLEA